MTAPSIVLYKKEDGIPVLLQAVVGLCNLSKEVTFKPAGKFQSRVELKIGATSINGVHAIARHLGRLNGSIYGADNLQASLIDEWIDEAHAVDTVVASGANIDDAVAWLALLANAQLRSRSFLVGHAVSLADLAVWAALHTQPLNLNDALASLPHLKRWLDLLNSLSFCSSVAPPAARSSAAASSSSSSSSAAASSSSASDDKTSLIRTKALELEGAVQGQVRTRFPPEPSGFMHLGHCKAAFFNYLTAQRYGGEMLLRFDDTNPATATQVYEDSFVRDLALLEVKYCKITHTSEHFDYLIEMCTKMIEAGHLYVDSSTDEEIKAQRGARQPSPFRDDPPETNLARWSKMVSGEDVKSVVRAKIDYNHVVGCLRDPNMFRSASEVHYRTGTKYKVYPLYDFACPIIDSLEGITHAFRSNEYHDRDALFQWVQEKTQVRPVRISDFGRLAFSYTLMSKRKLNWFVKQKIVDDWNHPAFPTVQGLFRRGVDLEALRDFVVRQGASVNSVLIDSDDLWARNRKVLEPRVSRYFGISRDNSYTLSLLNYTPAQAEARTVPLYRKKPEIGSKVISLSSDILLEPEDGAVLEPGSRITLMGWYNAVIVAVDHANKKATANLLPDDTDFASTVKLSWVARLPEQADMLVAKTVDFLPLIKKPKLDKGDPRQNKPADSLEEFANRDLEKAEYIFVEGAMRSLAKGSHVQLERRGYYIVDVPHCEARGQELVLVQIPEGRKTALKQPALKK